MPNIALIASLVAATGCLSCLAGEEKVLDFEQCEVGKAPAGFISLLTGKGREGVWLIQNDSTAPAGSRVLSQTEADETSARFPVCVIDGFKAKDVEVSTAFKAVSGKIDQAAGIVLRHQDKDNYYVVRANAAEDNVRLYHFVNGKRTQFAGKDIEVPAAKWHTLRIKLAGNHFTVWFNGQVLFEADDETIKNGGGVGLWTKADSVTRFDNVRITSLDAK